MRRELLLLLAGGWVAAAAQNGPPAASPAGRSVEATIQERPDGTLQLKPVGDGTTAIPLAPDQKLPEAAKDAPVNVRVQLENGTARITGVTLPVLADWSNAKANFAGSPDLVGAMDALKQASDRALHVEPASTPASPDEHVARDETGRSDLTEELGKTEEQIIAEYLKLIDQSPKDVVRRTQLVSMFVKTKRSNKALYGRPDYYASTSYLSMYNAAKSAVALAVADTQKAFCSGVLISRDLVLTARHCLTEFLPAELQVWLGYESGGDVHAAIMVKEKVAEGQVLEGGHHIDYAVLRLESDIGQFDKVATLQCLSEARLRRDNPVYVVGFPEGNPKTIHDNAWVLFPFAATETDYARLLMLVEAEFRDSPKREQFVEQFRKSYRLSPGDRMYQNYSARFGNQPILAVDADTFHGNSGSPAFDRQTHALVGVVVAGEEDSRDPWTPGWRRHEAIVPASQIIGDLQRFPEVRQAITICPKPGRAVAANTPREAGQ